MMSGVKTVLLLGGLSGLMLAIGGALGGSTGLFIAFIIAIGMNFGSYWFSDKIVLRMTRAYEVGPDHLLYRITERLVENTNLPMPRVYITPDQSPNAFATGRNPDHAVVAATEGLLQNLNQEELAGVMAHELAHVQNRDILISSIAATLAATILMLTRIAQFAMIFGNDGRRDNIVTFLATLILAPLAAALIQSAISRSREYEADRIGAHIAGTPEGLANALARMENIQEHVQPDTNPATAHMYIMMPFSRSGFMSLFSTHPPTEKRIRRLLS
ncbi:MAG: zinc metalloprotease HtpX [Bacteroidetes bacterium]|nr:zinc metalloprotease HtpX [Bacteroidota bacterium]MCY4234381.1 zinc metalloprotease HtpX [Bacteroidota bacterium]